MGSLNILCSDLLIFSNKVTKKIRKGKHEKIFCDPSKIFKDFSWPTNICLMYFLASTKTFRPPSYIPNVRSLTQKAFLVLLFSLTQDIHLDIYAPVFLKQNTPLVKYVKITCRVFINRIATLLNLLHLEVHCFKSTDWLLQDLKIAGIG